MPVEILHSHDEAVAAFDQLNQAFPNSPWARQARFAKGLAYARKGDFRNAELTYRAEAAFLFSEDRKQEIADIYLEYADTYFKPPQEDQKPDYAKALDFYGRALGVGPKLESRVRLELLIAQCQQKLDKFAEAAELYRKFLREHVDHALVVEARFRLGETLLANDAPAEARLQVREQRQRLRATLPLLVQPLREGVMMDMLRASQERAKARSAILSQLGLAEKGYLLATIHRAENTADAARLQELIKALLSLQEPVVLPLHPRTRKALEGCDLKPGSGTNLKIIQPLGYLDMVRLVSAAQMVLTDSGGLQKEAYWLGVPCVTLREETEWVETVQAGWNTLAGAEIGKILHAVRSFKPPHARPSLYGDGHAAKRCVELMLES